MHGLQLQVSCITEYIAVFPDPGVLGFDLDSGDGKCKSIIRDCFPTLRNLLTPLL